MIVYYGIFVVYYVILTHFINDIVLWYIYIITRKSPFPILLKGVLATGIMAVNAIIYGNPHGVVSGDQRLGRSRNRAQNG